MGANYQYIATPIEQKHHGKIPIRIPKLGEYYNVHDVSIDFLCIVYENRRLVVDIYKDELLLGGGSWKLIKVAKIHREVKGRYDR